MLAVNRTNEKVSKYYRPYHPSVLRALFKIVKAAERRNKETSICGEMAHESVYILFLLSIGVRRISVDPRFLPFVQKRIAGLQISDAEKYAEDLLAESTISEIQKITMDFQEKRGLCETGYLGGN